MATKTWSGGTSNWNDAANWTPAGVPVTGDDVIIDTAGATVTLDVHIGGGQTNTGLGSLTITAGTLYTNDGSNRMLKVTGTTIIGDGSSAAGTAKLYSSGSTLSLGEALTSDYGLNVKQGGTFEGTSGAAPTGDHTIGSFVNANHADSITKLTTHANGTIVTSEKSTSGSYGYAWTVYQNSTFDDSNGLVTFTGASLVSNSTALYGLHDKHLYNVTINASGKTYYLKTGMIIDNNLTITAGTFDTGGDSDSGLTVTGATTIGPNSGAADQATLTCNTSTVSLGASETSSFALRVAQGGTFTGGTGAHTIGSLEVVNSAAAKCTMTSGECSISSERSGDNRAILVETNATFDNNDGTIKITHAGDTNIEFKSGTTSPKCPHNLTIDKSDNDVVTHGDLRIDNNLFIKIVDTSHSMRPSSASDTLTVIGDVTLNKGKLGASTNYTSAISFGSLTIDADGEYIATSGTTEITGGGANGDANQSLYGEGTFTHNNGTLHFTSTALHRIPKGGTFYNVTSDCNLYGYTSTMLPQPTLPDGTTDADFLSILGTLQINNAQFTPYSIDGLYVHNLIIGDDTGSANTAKFDMADSDAFDGKVLVDNVTINSDGKLLFGDGHADDSDTLSIYGAFRNIGGSVDIE